MRRIFSLIVAGLLCAAPSFAQYTNIIENGTTQTVNSVWDSTGSDIWVGDQTPGNILHITQGATVTNANTVIGRNAGSDQNYVQVDGGSAVGWTNTGTLTVGQDGSDNKLGIYNSAVVQSASGVVGGTASAASNVVDVAGGRWDISGSLALQGTNGSVTISEGGAVSASGLDIGANNKIDLNQGGTLAMTDGLDLDAQPNLNWNSGSELVVSGEFEKSGGVDGESRTLTLDEGRWNRGSDAPIVSGTGNTFNIENGSGTTNGNGYVVGTNNTVAVSGEGSSWVNNGGLYISNANNIVTVQTGGTIRAAELWIADDSRLDLISGGTLAMTGDFNVSEQTNLNWYSAGNVSVEGELTGMSVVSNSEMGETAVLDGSRFLTLDGPDGVWSHGGTNLSIGYNASASTLNIVNGATVDNANGYIGWGSSARQNAVIVSDAGSTWTNAGGKLYVGAYTSGSDVKNTEVDNSLTVSNNAWVMVGDAVPTDLTAADSGGLLVASSEGAELVVGAGSVDVEQTLYLGVDSGVTGTNVIRSGGSVSVGAIEIAENSLLDLQRGGSFAVGSGFDVSANEFNWGDGAHVSVGGNLTGMTTTNIGGAELVLLTDEKDLTLDGGNLDASDGLIVGIDQSFSELLLKNAGTLTSGTTYLGYSTNALGSSITIDSASMWDNSGDLFVGYEGSISNTLAIKGGSMVDVGGDAYIGSGAGSFNSVQVSGTNSAYWSVGGNLEVGDGGEGNSLQVADNGEVEIDGNLLVNSENWVGVYDEGLIALGGNMTVSSNTALMGDGSILFTGNGSTLLFNGNNIQLSTNLLFDAAGTSGGKVEVDRGVLTIVGSSGNNFQNFETLELNDSTLTGYGAIDSFDEINMLRGEISPSGVDSSMARLEISGDFSADNTVYTTEIDGDENDELVFTGSGAVELSGLTANVTVYQQPGNFSSTIISADGGLTGGFAATNIVDYLLLQDAELEVVGNDVVINVVDSSDEMSSALTYAGVESIRAGFNGMKGTIFARTKQLRRNMVASDYSIASDAFLLTTPDEPEGPQGPGDENIIFDMNIWVQQYNGKGDFDSHGESDGFHLNYYGTTFGIDKLVGDGLIVGLNYTYANARARTKDNDSVDSETYWLGAYGEWVSENGLYVDGMVALGSSDYHSRRVEENYRGTASYRGYDYGAYVDVGQYYHHKNLALSPYVGMNFLHTTTDSYSEKEANGSRVDVDEHDVSWLEAVAGIKLRHRFDTRYGRFQTTTFAEYTYDVIQDDIYATLSANGLPSRDMHKISPDAYSFNTGLGISLICTDNLELGLGYNGRFNGDSEEHTASGMMNIRF